MTNSPAFPTRRGAALRTRLRSVVKPACALLLSASCALSTAADAPNTSVAEHDVKAAILYRVAKFIEWPDDSFANDTAPFVVCVAGDTKSLAAFDALSGRTIDNRSIAVRRVTGDMIDLRACHAAFFASDSNADVDYALVKLRGLPVLTVGEAEEFARRGGMLALVTRDRRVTFAINLNASRRARLNVSSQFLQLATVVDKP
jgi:hypothetical protein